MPMDKGGMAGYVSPVMRKKNKKAASKKGNFKPGGSYTSGRAIPPSPGTKYTGGSKKESNMAKAQQRGRVTSAMPSKGPNKNTNKKYR